MFNWFFEPNNLTLYIVISNIMGSFKRGVAYESHLAKCFTSLWESILKNQF